MITTLTNLIKAAAAVAISPAAVVADVLTLPSTAYEGRPAFGKTASLMQAAGRLLDGVQHDGFPEPEGAV